MKIGLLRLGVHGGGLEREEEDRSRCAVGVDAVVPHHGDTKAVIGGGHSFSVIARRNEQSAVPSGGAPAGELDEPLRRGRAVRHGGDAADADAQAAHSERDVRQEALQEGDGEARGAYGDKRGCALSEVRPTEDHHPLQAASAVRDEGDGAGEGGEQRGRSDDATRITTVTTKKHVKFESKQELLAQLEHKVKGLYVQEVRAGKTLK
ncbi:hypothetical protein PHYSODRAFT_332291 [Phytophthora sojae]|uniref:Uncharacterized protein n=1 Tax=Phytophthora sojae (strain P6497) TaxID=1094619 RepID=G4ZFP5_PHYSP|nr:hypothetical protein PHYSODRAFT_332291 [Phytophthora sojae]EGZ18513.1 hypothetical protein PHYSODRAFT_332291 [Phytophthora sojae]|eukprot:XP_009527571.1 hypothetical protein PHYSODRAFT_332291 [Phytophthora sojae]